MTAQTALPDPRLLSGAMALVERAVELSRGYDADVQALVREASQHPIAEDSRERLFTRIVTILLNDGKEPDDDDRVRLSDEVHETVRALLSPPSGPQLAPAPSATEAETKPAIELVEKYGHVPHDVVPVPLFKGMPVHMREGYVDITTVNLWKGNHRVELFVAEFRDREGREPEDHELLAILQGDLHVGGTDKLDPFDIKPLAESIAAKGVERPPILTWDGEPKDGNRRIAAAKYVLSHEKEFDDAQRDRARWVRVWVAPKTTEDVIENIVVALNFESDHKKEWEEYIKARLVADRFKSYLEAATASGSRVSDTLTKRLKQEVAAYYAIKVTAVTRYLRMVQWANDFEAYHVEDKGRDEASVRYKANDIFQWFYEIDAGKAGEKLTDRLYADEELKEIVYDLMYEVLDSGAQVRQLHKVIGDEPAMRLLTQAHAETDHSEAKKVVLAAIAEAAKNSPARKLGFEQWLKSAVERLDATPPMHWQAPDTKLLRDLRRVLTGAVGAIEGELQDRGVALPDAEAVGAP